LHRGGDNKVEIINESNNLIKDQDIAIETIDLTNDNNDEIPFVDMIKEEEEEEEEDNQVIDLTFEDTLKQDDTDHSLIKYIIENGDNMFDNVELTLNEEINNIRGVQYPHTTMDDYMSNQDLDGYWSPRSFF